MFKCFLMVLLVIISVRTSVADDTSDASNPYELMNKVTKKTFDRLKIEKNNIKKNPNYLREIVREELLPYVQFKYAGALVLGSYYKTATQIQRDAYFKAFNDYLTYAYAQALSMYEGETYKVASEKSLNDNINIITIQVNIISSRGHTPLHLNFQWRKNSITGKWQVFDMMIEGVSMIITKQNEWSIILRQKGIDELTKNLQIYANQPIILDKKY